MTIEVLLTTQRLSVLVMVTALPLLPLFSLLPQKISLAHPAPRLTAQLSWLTETYGVFFSLVINNWHLLLICCAHFNLY